MTKINKRCPVCHEPFLPKSPRVVIKDELQHGKWSKPKKYHPYCLLQHDRGIVGEIHL